MEKECMKCKKLLLVNEANFHKNKNTKGGFSNTCKNCVKAYNDSRREERRKLKREWYEKNIEHVKEYDRKRKEENPELIKQHFKKYYENNKEYFSEKAKKYREENREKLIEHSRKYNKPYREENREKIAEQKRLYYQKNKAKARIAMHKRVSLEYSVPHTLTKEEWEETLNFFDYKDAYTGLKMEVVSQDHVIPVSKGGGYTKQNIIPCETNVNKSKGNRDMEIWYRKQDYFSEERLKKIYEFMNAKDGTFQISIFG